MCVYQLNIFWMMVGFLRESNHRILTALQIFQKELQISVYQLNIFCMMVGFLRESNHRILTAVLRAIQIFKKELQINVCITTVLIKE